VVRHVLQLLVHARQAVVVAGVRPAGCCLRLQPPCGHLVLKVLQRLLHLCQARTVLLLLLLLRGLQQLLPTSGPTAAPGRTSTKRPEVSAT
jgi:hypothetical protein